MPRCAIGTVFEKRHIYPLHLLRFIQLTLHTKGYNEDPALTKQHERRGCKSNRAVDENTGFREIGAMKRMPRSQRCAALQVETPAGQNINAHVESNIYCQSAYDAYIFYQLQLCPCIAVNLFHLLPYEQFLKGCFSKQQDGIFCKVKNLILELQLYSFPSIHFLLFYKMQRDILHLKEL